MKKFLITVIISCLTTAVSEAATYYVAKTGSNSNTCTQAQSQSTPKLTVGGGASCLVAGDTLYIKAGTYSETHGSIRLPAATSWAGATTVSNFGSDVVTFRNAGNPFYVKLTPAGATLTYVIFNGLVFDGTDGSGSGIAMGVSSHIRFTNVEVKNFTGVGAMGVIGSGDGNEFLNCSVHNNGLSVDYDHGFYIQGSNWLVDGCQIYNNSGYGIHNYHFSYVSNNNVFRNNTVYGNGASSIQQSYGIRVGSGSGNAAYNNVLYGGFFGIQVAGEGSLVYNNTIYNHRGWGMVVEFGNNGVIKNNIVYNNTDGTILINGATGTVQSNNLTTDPKFVNPSIKNFHLQTGSAAIDAGTDLLSKRLTVDFAGGARPQGCCIDIGAYEYGSPVLPAPSNPIAPTNLIAGP